MPAGLRRYYPGLLESAAVAHIVAGFTQRRPALIETAMNLLRAVRLVRQAEGLPLPLLVLGRGAPAGQRLSAEASPWLPLGLHLHAAAPPLFYLFLDGNCSP